MQNTAIPTLNDLLTAILVIATRFLRELHLRASTTSILKTILATHQAAARIGRAIRLTTLLIRRIQTHGLLPLPPARPRPIPRPIPANAAPITVPPFRAPRTQITPALHIGNGDAAFIRRPIHIVIAAITRELYLAAQAVGVTLPESLQILCLKAALASTQHTPETTETPTPTPAAPILLTLQQCLKTPIFPHQTTPAPAETLEL